MPEMPCARISGIWNSLSKCSSAVIQQNMRVRRQSASGIAAVATTRSWTSGTSSSSSTRSPWMLMILDSTVTMPYLAW